MNPLGYLTDCPHCGASLQPHVGPGQDAPWLCVPCARGYWCAELAGEARKTYRPRHRDFGHALTPGVVEEHAAAITRKHSVHESMAAVPGVAERLAVFLTMGRG